MSEFCEEHNIRRCNLDHTTTGLFYMKNGYKAFRKEDWENEPDKEKFLSGDFVNDVKKKISTINAKTQSRTYKIQFPDGHIETVNNLKQFERDNNLKPNSLSAAWHQNIRIHGYKVLEKID